jgi:hypothetical protein
MRQPVVRPTRATATETEIASVPAPEITEIKCTNEISQKVEKIGEKD